MTKEIPILSKGETFIALVDDEDYPVVSRHKWYILYSKDLPYAFTKLYNESGKGLQREGEGDARRVGLAEPIAEH